MLDEIIARDAAVLGNPSIDASHDGYDSYNVKNNDRRYLLGLVKELSAALLEAAARLRVAAIAGGSDEEYADLAVERYTKLLDLVKS